MKKMHVLSLGLLLVSGAASAQFVGEFFVQGDGVGQTAQQATYQAEYNTLIQCAMRGVGGRLHGPPSVSGGNGHYYAYATGVCGSAYGGEPALPY